MKELLIKRCCITIFFFSFLLTGLNVFKDYGVHYDEYLHQSFSNANFNYIIDVWNNHSIARTSPLPETTQYLTHGPFVEICLSLVKKSLGLTDPRDVLWMRHLSCFLIFFLGVIFFYLLCNIYFKNWKISLLGCLFLVLSPRIFANSFYDIYDTPFLSLYIICMYTLLRLAHQKTNLNIFLHALTCAFLIATRQIGLILPLVTLFLFFIDLPKHSSLQTKIKRAIQFAVYMAIVTVLTIVFWPFLWNHPYLNFIKALNANFLLNYPMTALYMGKLMPRESLPWHYAPVWILITTPLLYSFYFIIGFFVSLKLIFNDFSGMFRKNNILLMFYFLVPLIVSKGKIYDSWRHIFFIYPAFLIFALMGLFAIWERIKILRSLITAVTILALVQTGYVMVKNHPFENVYFNSLAGKDMQEIKTNFDLDYWGLSFRQGLEYILKTDKSKTILVAVEGGAPYIQNNLNILPDQDQKRLKEVPLPEAEYFLTNYREHPQEYPYPEYYSIKVGDASILGIYKLKSANTPE